MKPTNFSKYLTDFLLRYLPHERGASTNTIHSYRDTFTLYLVYMESKGVKAEKLTMESITKENILSFLDCWKQKEVAVHQHVIFALLPYNHFLSTSNIRVQTIYTNIKK